MSKKLRDWLFILFIVAFVITTFFVSLYAVGYTISRRWPPRFNQLFQKTGMLIIDSKPTGATIFINGDRQRRSFLLDIGQADITTPTKIKNLPPGEYTLRLEKEGYWPLEKKFRIDPGQTTFAEDSILFKQSLPLNLTLCSPQALSLSPDKKTLLLPVAGTVINLKTEAASHLASSTDSNIQWSKNSSQILLNKQLLSISGGQVNYDLSQLGQAASNFYWDEAAKKIYYQSTTGINCVLTENNTVSTILSGHDYATYAVKDNLIYTVEKQDGQDYLRVYDAGTVLLQSNASLPSGDYQFRQNEYRLDLYDRKQQALYILDNYAQQPIIRQIKPVKNWQWLDKNSLIWYNDFEVYSLDTTNNQQELLIRVSDPLTGLAWNKTKNYLVYSNGGQIYLINLSLEKKTPISLLKAEQIANLTLDEKNQFLYFYAKIGNQAGIYKLQLQ